MGMSVGGAKRGTFIEMNVVPLIDILLVLLVIFMIIPNSRGMKVQVPQQSFDPPPKQVPDVVVVQVLADGSLKLNQRPVSWAELRDRLPEVFKFRAERVAFVRGENLAEFQMVAQVIDDMRAAGISSVGLLTPELEPSH
jgi:biopolymer transport protein TolR